MRIWSIHPKYLDSKGLVALWRETLLAKNVLQGKTKGYINHPQLDRFKATQNPLKAINFYLSSVWLEANKRGYNFNKNKFEETNDVDLIKVTDGQMLFEKKHLQNKLETRDFKKYTANKSIANFETHPLFNCVDGEIEPWEKI